MRLSPLCSELSLQKEESTMSMIFIKKDLSNYISKIYSRQYEKITLNLDHFINEKFAPFINPIISTLPKSKQINDVAKQLSELIYEYDLKNPDFRNSNEASYDFRQIANSIDYLVGEDTSGDFVQYIHRITRNRVRLDDLKGLFEFFEGMNLTYVKDREALSITFSHCHNEYLAATNEIESIRKIRNEALTIVVNERSAKKAYQILKGLDFPLEEFEKEMTLRTPKAPAIYKFSEPVCKLTASCED